MDKIPVELLCPICLDFPENEAFQCGQGHIICSKCIAKLQKCPQCLEPFEKSKIRNRVVESLLEPYKVDCPHKHLGCDKKFFKDKLATHEQICIYGEESLNICKDFQYKCEALVNIRDVAATVDHLKSHSFHDYVLTPSRSSFNFALDFNMLDHKMGIITWRPTFLHFQGQLFLARARYSVEKEFDIAWFKLERDSKMKKKYKVEIMIKDATNKGQDLKWTLPITTMLSRNGKLIFPEIRVSSDFILESYTKNGTLRINFRIIDVPDNTVNNLSTLLKGPCGQNGNCVIC